MIKLDLSYLGKKIDWSAFWNCEHVLVKGHAGSAAQKFCEQAELNFEVIE